jgi:hypothetical protein
MEEREQKGKTPLIGPDGGRIKKSSKTSKIISTKKFAKKFVKKNCQKNS